MADYRVTYPTNSPTNATAYAQFTQNNTNATNYHTPYEHFPYELWQLALFTCFIIPVIVLSIIGNIIVIIAVVKKPYLQIAGNIFLASLAVADCFIAVFVMPLNAIQLLFGRWYLKAFICR
jgi:hypothetical protein